MKNRGWGKSISVRLLNSALLDDSAFESGAGRAQGLQQILWQISGDAISWHLPQ